MKKKQLILFAIFFTITAPIFCENIDLEGIYEYSGRWGNSIKIRKIEDSDSYIVEFGIIKNGKFFTKEGKYSYFSSYDYPNIEFSCPLGRARKSIPETSTFGIYKLKFEKKDDELYLTGNIYHTSFDGVSMSMWATNEQASYQFKRVAGLSNDPTITFFKANPEDVPMNLRVTSFDESGIVCNSKKLEFAKSYDLKNLVKEIGTYSGSDEFPGGLKYIYPNLNLHFNPANYKFIAVSKNFTTREKLTAFGFDFSYKTTIQEVEDFAKKNSYEFKKEIKLNYKSFKFWVNKNIEVYTSYNNNTSKLKFIRIDYNENISEE